jgi:outer membrane protein OmpA-like peptidoglycan-associated protein
MRRLKAFTVAVSMVGLLVSTTSFALAQQQRMESSGRAVGAFRVSGLSDYEVMNQHNETIGNITDYVITPQGRIQYVVIAPASWWGAADRRYLIPWSAFTPNREMGAMYLNISQERLQNAPSFSRNNWPNLASANWDNVLQRYYGQQTALQGQQSGQQPMPSSAARGQRSGADTIMNTAVRFDFGEARLNNEGRATLDHLVSQLHSSDFGAIHLTGHADQTGSDAVNFELARRRAARVASYLVEQGIEPHKIRVLSLGSEMAATAGQEGVAAQDRRVDIAVLRPDMAGAAGTQEHKMQGARMQQQADRPGGRLAATVQSIDMNNGTITVQTEYGDSVELQAREGLLQSIQAGDRVEVRLRKVEGSSQQQRSGQTEPTQEQQAR